MTDNTNVSVTQTATNTINPDPSFLLWKPRIPARCPQGEAETELSEVYRYLSSGMGSDGDTLFIGPRQGPNVCALIGGEPPVSTCDWLPVPLPATRQTRRTRQHGPAEKMSFFDWFYHLQSRQGAYQLLHVFENRVTNSRHATSS